MGWTSRLDVPVKPACHNLVSFTAGMEGLFTNGGICDGDPLIDERRTFLPIYLFLESLEANKFSIGDPAYIGIGMLSPLLYEPIKPILCTF
jgi:hypothetical protein